MRIFRAVKRRLHVLVRSPVTKSVAGGLAIAFPTVGVSAVAALALADRALTMAEQSPQRARELGRALSRTRELARAGDRSAMRAMRAFELVRGARRGEPAAVAQVRAIGVRATIGASVGARYRVRRDGRVERRV